MTPTIGRIVHYKDDGNIWPAMVLKVSDGTIYLQVFSNDECSREFPSVNQTNDMAISTNDAINGQWFWPERL